MKRKLIATALIVSIMCCGCGKKNVESMQEDFDKVTEGETIENGGSSSSGQSGNTEIPEHINFEISDATSTKKIIVDADVLAEGVESACVYEATMVEIDEDYVVELAKKIFDNGEYEVLLPYKLLPDWQLEEIIEEEASAESKANSEGDFAVGSIVWEEAAYAIKNKDDLQETELKEGYIMYPYEESVSLMDDFGVFADEAKSDSCELARIRGTIDGKEYELCVKTSAIDQRAHVDLHTVDVCTNENFELEFDNSLETVYGENVCDYAQAREIADRVVNTMVGSDYSITSEYSRMVATREITDSGVRSELNGYRFIYTPEMMGLKVAYSPCALVWAKDSESDYSYLPYVVVEVDSFGLVSVKYMNQMEYGKCLSDRPSMISFDQVLEIAKSEIQEELKEMDVASLEIARLRFVSIPVVSEDGLALIPAWVAYLRPYTEMMQCDYAVTAINALDGSILYMLMDGNTFLED